MSRQPSLSTWSVLEVPSQAPPRAVRLRVQSIPPRHYFPDHEHTWSQMVYAISGVLTVTTRDHCFVVPSEQAVWLPPGTRHRVGSLLGAEFRSLYVAADADVRTLGPESVFEVGDLMRALIVEAAAVGSDDEGYFERLTVLMLDQLRRSKPVPYALPWPRTDALTALCQALYEDPSDDRDVGQWATLVGLSERTLSRRFEAELGMTMRDWRKRLRLVRGVELLGAGRSVTQVALELGYSSTSAFVFMFRTALGRPPHAYTKAFAAKI